MAEVRAFGPGKIILLGEHGVVYGHPAIAAPLPLGVTASAKRAPRCELVLPARLPASQRRQLSMAFDAAAKSVGRPAFRFSLQSDLPVSMGLGSSAAVSVALSRALLAASGRGPEELLSLALSMETVFHGRPSGVDHTTSALGRVVRFEKGHAEGVALGRPLSLVVLLLGKRPATKVTVASLRERQGKWPARYGRLFEQIALAVDEGAAAMREGDLESLGDVMNVNQGLLSALGLSSPGIEDALERLRARGALGAKLTGAGGDGGAVISLFPNEAAAKRAGKAIGRRAFALTLKAEA